MSDMSRPDELLDPDFEAQLRGLFQQAERAMEGRTTPTEKPSAGGGTLPATQTPPIQVGNTEPLPTAGAVPSGAAPGSAEPVPGIAITTSPAEQGAPKAIGLSLPQMLKPVVLGLEAVSRATTENAAVLKRLDTAAASNTEAGKQLPSLVADLRALVESKNGLNQSMFAALHQELKGYKDGFLLDSVHRPLIRDMISLYDDTAEIHRQVAAAIAESEGKVKGDDCASALFERIRTIEMNLEHHMEFIVEVLNRLEVTLLPPQEGRLDKQTQRAVAVEMAEDPDEDGKVVRAVKCGFMWKDRIFRAEEVVIKKWKEGFLVALKSDPKQ